MTINHFSSGLELANFVVISDPVHQAWSAIENQKQINPNAEPCLYNFIQQSSDLGPTIIAFGTPLGSLQGQGGLISSSILKETNFTHFEFLCNKTNPSFSLSLAVIELFRLHYDDLLLLKSKLLVENSKSKSPPSIIITGQSVGGSVATLFTLWLLEGLNLLKTKRPLCITFGSPLVGDEHLRQCVLQFSAWQSCFLHVAFNQDPTPNIFQSRNTNAGYKPFGTFLLCSALGCACFDHPDIILEQLATDSQIAQNQDPKLECHYGKILGDLRCKTLCNVFYSTEERNPIQASIITQLQAIGVHSEKQPSTEIYKRMITHETKLLIQKKKNSHSDKKLNEMKVHMVFLEWYMKDSKQHKIGYYDRYRNQGNISDVDVNGYKKKLMNYWEDSVTEVENKPQIEGAHFRVRWLWAGTNYRRMVEPLHIADYYRDGGKNYKTDGERPKHFILLENWLKRPDFFISNNKKQMVPASLTKDSCFWAHVEEAIILCNLLHNGVSITDAEKLEHKGKLKEFEAYVWDALENYAVSPEIFLEASSFMKWWKLYRGTIVEMFYTSPLAGFMNRETYKEGIWCPLGFDSNEYRKIGENLKLRNQQTEENLKSGKQQIEENLKMRNRKTAENLNMWNQFSSGLESANLLVNSDLVHQAWDAIEEQKEINPDAQVSLCNEIQKSNLTVLAFGTPFGSLQGKKGLISSSTLMEEDFPHFEFLCNKSNPRFSINVSAISIFRANYAELNLLKTRLVQMSSRTSSLIITGHSVGGSVAILFTLWLLHSFNLSKTKRPLCITFGSPLLGDEWLRQCVSEFSTWKSCFLHVASNQDPIPKLFLSQNPSGTYKPFGTFLLCSASGCACFEEPDTILEWLVIADSQNSQTQDPDLRQQFFDYGLILKDLKLRALYIDDLQFAEGEIDPLQASIITQLQAIGFPPTQQKEPYTEANSVIKRMERHEKLLTQRKNVSDSFKKLTEMQLCMARLELYKKEAKCKKIGYYDMYKKLPNTSDIDVYDYKKKLMSYWQEFVAEEEYKPHEEGDFIWTSWLMAGTSYRRMVEPLHIAEYYMEDGAENYKRRPRHFILLEQWWKEREKPEASQNNAWIKRQVAASRLNEDSCFWARVEEAIISCNLLNNYKESNIQDTESSKQKLEKFEEYVYDAIKNNEVSLDIFLEGSSFRQWWNKYESLMGSSHCSSLMLKFWEGMGARSSPSS